ncbi:hypothetical protein [Methylacidiphilum caldifontis]|uniref:Uncharacterized protein n=1 Tax=Methylacidiphilum caldifontis TaxID=2795386 RepID=A0A4Y8PAF2_9BACT|nr:hypothetical protein [Methylacidiphilum caldifontis]TFE67527.1 hypothetical protein A7Q10_09490 [Methylacidiphilum caldifontis]
MILIKKLNKWFSKKRLMRVIETKFIVLSQRIIQGSDVNFYGLMEAWRRKLRKIVQLMAESLQDNPLLVVMLAFISGILVGSVFGKEE